MKYITSIGDQQFEIEINSDDEITIDGQMLSVDFQTVADQPDYSMILDGESHEASIHSTETGLQVLLRGQLFEVVVEDERQRRLQQNSGGIPVHGGELQIKSPMPGLVITVPVEDGQEIEKGANLIILESMKMQNEIKAPRDGKVTRVSVAAGDSVDQNQLLLTLS
jgi:biotin carboxyl carrier protein